MKKSTGGKYIVKIISIPASQSQLDALLLSGAYRSVTDAAEYFRQLSEEIAAEVKTLSTLSTQAGFLPFEGCQIVPMGDNQLGYQVYLLSSYKQTMEKLLRRSDVSGWDARAIGLRLCSALSAARKTGFMYADLKPTNIYVSTDQDYRIGDLGFVPLSSLGSSPLPAKYHTAYSPPETADSMHTLDGTADTYALGLILYQLCNRGILPSDGSATIPPSQADQDLSGVILKAISPNPADRWQDPDSMYRALTQCGNQSFRQERDTLVFSTDFSNPPRKDAALSDTRVLSHAGSPASKVLPKSPVPIPSEPEYGDYDDPEYEEEVTRVVPGSPGEQERRRRPMGKGWIAPVVLLLLAVLLGGAGYNYYQNYYLLNINSLSVDGMHNELTVTVDTDIDKHLLQVTCTDTYGNTQRSMLSDGVAQFTDLKPNCQYRIQLEVAGFHKLVGKTSEVFNTESRTEIISFTGIAGAEDGSVMLTFTVEGPEPPEWIISYSAEGEEEKSQQFTGHSVTITDLVVPKRYTFRLSPSEQMYVTGETSMDHTASRLVLAQNLVISSCDGNELTARWDTPEGCSVSSWTVRCFSDGGKEQVLETTENKAVFSEIEPSLAYQVEVTADGMTQNVRTGITPNPITVTSLKVGEDDPMKLTVSWDFHGIAPDGGWLLMYTLDGSNTKSVIKVKNDCSAVISPRIPGAEYRFELQAADSTSIFNNFYTYSCPDAAPYTEHSFDPEKTTAKLVVTPEKKDWTSADVTKDDYTDTFSSGEAISIVLDSSARFYIPNDAVSILYVIRNSSGCVDVKLISEAGADWHDLWVDYNTSCAELDLPTAPTEAGDYSLSIYFNGRFVASAPFSIKAADQ